MKITKQLAEGGNWNVTINGKVHCPDHGFQFPLHEKEIKIKDCVCIFSILNRKSLLIKEKSPLRQYVGIKYFRELNDVNILEPINGFKPETVYCFEKVNFPIPNFDALDNLTLGDNETFVKMTLKHTY